MCGISGIIRFDGITVDRDSAIAMADVIRHRGPDDEGYLLANFLSGRSWLQGGPDTPDDVYRSAFPYSPRAEISSATEAINLVMSNRRLAILDLSPAGHQPMCNQDGTVWIVHNGEIYNFKELKTELTSLGHTFSSGSDTEVILHAYDEWGTDCVKKLNGMWAFCIWDAKRKRLFCSRDRFGIKPFYYVWDGNIFLFASEIKSILASGYVKPRVNDFMVHDYLAFGKVDHTEETFFHEVKQLRGGHFLDVDLQSASLKLDQYYDIPLTSKQNNLSGTEYAEEFLRLFTDSVRLRLISDVQVGACLSGGLDSSSIVCTMDKLIDRKEGSIKSFSARHDDPRHDEGSYIQEVVDSVGIDAKDVYPSVEGLMHELNDLIWHQEQPFGSTSIYAQWSVFDNIGKTGVKVVLDGQGADEVLGGYLTYNRDHLASLVRSGKFISFCREAYQHHNIHGTPWKDILAGAALYSSPTFMNKPTKAILRSLQANWMAKDFVTEFCDIERYDPIPVKTNSFDQALYRSFQLVLPSLLRYEDSNSMAHSIESRLPFLDYRLVEWVFSTPTELKIHRGTTKVVLRDAMKGILPERVRTRQDKVGFSTPEDTWMRVGLKPFIEELLESDSFFSRPYFNHKRLRYALDSHLNAQRNISTVIWTWVNLELWLRRFID